jgi:endogenous inhibitor of DNA gyrase (YacG/DUF329 family)
MPRAADPPAGGDGGSGSGQGPARPPASKPFKPCPICGKPASPAVLPFCSPRCRDVDLNRWFSGSYVVPGADQEDEE